ncbi:hypothetical protein LTR37_001661 [Vermiconidia calcicola]|uniref:Uncharacterized protein n=1 Tax=Vermiconidia calcicola TaxID=1690605 RepID=A0ACC3NVG3_9PEZI|nr:hypothetical protein LTR37_001661 [Vermiconidia calcicola]
MAEYNDAKVITAQTAEDLDGVLEYHVEGKYEGTDQDKLDMKVLGRSQETRRMFTWITMLGFGSTLIVTWEALLASMGAIITNGGTAGMFWGFLIVIAGYLMVYSSIAEMASMAATSGGQYHWVSEFAPPSTQKYLSYVTGWLGFTGWQSAITALGYLIASVIQALAILNYPSYVAERWHASLIIICVVMICIVFNTFFAKRLPLVESALALLHFGGLFVVIIVLWTLAPRNNAHDVFLEFRNDGGWSSDGLSMLVGLYPLTFSLLGFDSQVHMSEETSDASWAMPRSIMWATYINASLGFLMVITLIFTMGDLVELSKTATGFPFVQLFYNATESYAGATVLTVITMLPLWGSCIACIATASRQIWAFARDSGVPFSNVVRQIYPRWSIPLNAIIISLFVCIGLSMINIASVTALNAILAIDLAAILSSYTISIGCVALKRIRGEPLPVSKYSLGKWGLPINILALCWLVPIFFFTMFPATTPVDAAGMNWGCLLFGSMFLFSTCYYLLRGRNEYISPRDRLHRELEGGLDMSRSR